MAPRKSLKRQPGPSRKKPGSKPRTQLGGKPVPKPMLTISDEAHIAYAVEMLRGRAPHLLAETKPLGPTDARIGNTIIRGEDPVNHPSHYMGGNGLECIDCQEAAVSNSPLDGFAAHLLSTAIGYAFRCGKKGEALQDAEKLQWYANRLVNHLMKKEA